MAALDEWVLGRVAAREQAFEERREAAAHQDADRSVVQEQNRNRLPDALRFAA